MLSDSNQRETAIAQWLRYCATNRNVAGSIPDGVIWMFHWNNLSDRTMALGSTQPLTEMCTRSIFWGVKAAGAQGWPPYHHSGSLSRNLGTLTSWNPLGATCMQWDWLTFIYTTLCVSLYIVLNRGVHGCVRDVLSHCIEMWYWEGDLSTTFYVSMRHWPRAYGWG